MQKLTLNQSLQQRLSPQQIQFIKLLQIPTAELNQRIEEELEINPALEDGYELNTDDTNADTDTSFDDEYAADSRDEIDIKEYINQEDYYGYKMQGDGWGEEEKDTLPIASTSSLTDSLLQQLSYLDLPERHEIIGKQLIGSLEDDGYIRRPLKAIANDLAFTQNVYTNEAEVEQVLRKIQLFEPPGIAARDLRECLILQLVKHSFGSKNERIYQIAILLLKDLYEEFTKKHFEKIQRKLDISDEDFKEVMNLIKRLSPKPGISSAESTPTNYIIPDFIVTSRDNKVEVFLNTKNAPDLRISRSFSEMLETYDKGDKKNKHIKETVTFVKQKLDAAKWFIEAIKQRQLTLQKTMEAIVSHQYGFFLDGDESKLKPMILKDIAERIQMDISTVSRVASSKTVQTDFGTYPLKYFFSEGISTESGEDASSREVKNIIKELIEKESKAVPLSDDKLEKILTNKGYNIARRTVAKYREQLGLPVSRLRKEV
ncbi:MAG: RNA polymerase factor sigma-54 [Spirosomataceae bacterium]